MMHLLTFQHVRRLLLPFLIAFTWAVHWTIRASPAWLVHSARLMFIRLMGIWNQGWHHHPRSHNTDCYVSNLPSSLKPKGKAETGVQTLNTFSKGRALDQTKVRGNEPNQQCCGRSSVCEDILKCQRLLEMPHAANHNLPNTTPSCIISYFLYELTGTPMKTK